MAKEILQGALKPIGPLVSQDINQAPITSSDQIWVLKEDGTHQILDDFLSSMQAGTAQSTIKVYSSSATALGGVEGAHFVSKETLPESDRASIKVGDLLFVANGSVYLVKSVDDTNVGVKEPALASFGTADALKGITGRVEALEGYFEKGVAKNAKALNGHADTYFAVKTDLDGAVARITAVEGKFTENDANNALKLEGHDAAYFATATALQGLVDAVNGKSTIYVFKDVTAMNKALKDDVAHTKYKVGDTFLIEAKNVPDYWVSSILEAADETTGFYGLSELETKVDLAASGIQTAINTAADKAKTDAISEAATDATTKADAAKTGAIAAAKTETTAQVEAAKTELNKTISDNKAAADTAIADAKKAGTDAQTAVNALSEGQVTTNKNDIATAKGDITKLKDPKATATKLEAGQAPTASVTVPAEGENAGKPVFTFGIPKGDRGVRGRNIYVASVNISSGADVNKADIVNGSTVEVGDTVFDNKGDCYTIESVADTTVQVSAAIAGLNIKGPKGDKGNAATIEAGTLEIDGSKAASVTLGGTENARTVNINVPVITSAEFNDDGALVFTTNIEETATE